ncbi:N-acyl amino acid synthase FeeM domain-containing protein [Ramlibacter agri]|uniref:N-acyl amino acid synthase FeeM domain-containing protein n=1 Tax=Ramlibacter agri TaxID=2728837 RepID=UPI00197D3548|nr:N-acetyltransferase [Ramlibacter agri]
MVGAFLRFGAYIGTIRVLPLARNVAPCDKMIERHDIAPELLENAWEVGRLVVDPHYRGGPEFLRRCLFLTICDMLEHSRLDNLFASCTPVLARLYRRFGFRVLVKDAAQAGEGSYCLIHGHMPEVLRALAGNEGERELAEEMLIELEEEAMVLQ